MRIIVAGTGMRGSGYPNAENTLRILRDHGQWEVVDRAHWLPEGAALWKSVRGGWRGMVGSMAKLWFSGLRASIGLVLSREGRDHWVYAPYPAIFLLWWLSWVPRRWRPRVVADAYISLWDSAFRDRGFASAGSAMARAAKWFEARALRSASRVFVDTVANRDWMLREFGIDPRRIHAVPLAIDDRWFKPSVLAGSPAAPGPLRIVYVGTFVPLHGIDVMVAAVEALARDPRFRFHFAGDGQQAGRLRELAGEHHGSITWRQAWLSVEEVADLLADADLSFGVFGGDGKASRVLPFKVYLSLAAGTPVLTQGLFSLPEGVPPPPLITVPPERDALVHKLVALATDRRTLDSASRASRDYFQAHLGPRAILGAWSRWLGLDPDSPPPGQG